MSHGTSNMMEMVTVNRIGLKLETWLKNSDLHGVEIGKTLKTTLISRWTSVCPSQIFRMDICRDTTHTSIIKSNTQAPPVNLREPFLFQHGFSCFIIFLPDRLGHHLPTGTPCDMNSMSAVVLDDSRTHEAGNGRRFQLESFCNTGQRKQPEQLIVTYGVYPCNQPFKQSADETGRPADRETVCCRLVVQSKVSYRQPVMITGHHTDKHARGMHRFGKIAVNIIPENDFQSECYAAGTASHTARQIDIEGMVSIHGNILFGELLFQSHRRNSIAEE